MLKIYTVCVSGMGSSLLIRMSVEKAARELDISAEVEAINLAGLSSVSPNIVVTTPEVAKNLNPENYHIITVVNVMDVKKIKKELEEIVK